MKANINEIMFPVKEIPAIWADKENGNILNKNTGHKFIIREDTGQVLSCMTDNYKLITNGQILSKADPVLKEKGAKLTDVQMFAGGTRTKWTYRLSDTKVKVAKDDYLNPEITIVNSYDGSSEASAHGGAFRLVCSNGMVIG